MIELIAQFLNTIHRVTSEAGFTALALMASLSFGAIYFSMAALSYFFSRHLCPRLGIGTILDQRTLFINQIGWEIRHSLISILIFGLYGGVTFTLVNHGLLQVDWSAPCLGCLAAELLVFVIWNEIHFYAIHRSLHSKALYRRVHWVHHRSTVPTPLSTYSFHWLEALLLSSVMILIMPFHTFNIVTLMLFPLVSLLFNSIGHLNFTIFEHQGMAHVASASRRHAYHHQIHRGNYGFLLPYLDRWLQSAVKPKSPTGSDEQG